MTPASHYADDDARAGTDLTARGSVPVVVVGIGEIGQAVLRAALEDGRTAVMACVDPRPDRAEIARACGFEGPTFEELSKADVAASVAALCTSSRLEVVAPLAAEAVALGYDVVTTAEELIAPELFDDELATSLDAAARNAGRSILACGVNPGFAMDLLPALATLATRDVERVTVVRRTDVGKRRAALQAKVGVGISLEEFERRRVEGTVGHVGLEASIVCLARALGWGGNSEETIEPVPAPDGETALGVRHTAVARDENGQVRVDATLEMYAGAEGADEVLITGVPELRLHAVGGIAGDQATVSAVLNAIAGAPRLRPGIMTPLDLMPPVWSSAAP